MAPFLMPIEDVFSISGRGTVVTGRIERGIVKVGEEIEIVGIAIPRRRPAPVSRCSASCWTRARRATTSACCCAAPSVMTWSVVRYGEAGFDQAAHEFEAEVYVLSKDEGGRHTPFFNGYRPQFYFRTTDVTGACELPEGIEMVMPGDNVKMTVKLIAPIAMDEGLRLQSAKAVVPSAPVSWPRLSSNPGNHNG